MVAYLISVMKEEESDATVCTVELFTCKLERRTERKKERVVVCA